MKWANGFYPEAIEKKIGIKALNLHAFQVDTESFPGGPCNCNAELLRDQISHLYTKFELPIWLTGSEFE